MGRRAIADPRHIQIAVLVFLLGWGLLALDFALDPGPLAAILATALGTEFLGARTRGRRFDPRSPLITGLSLCLLLRTHDVGIAALAAFLAIASKFVFARGDRHWWNPSAFGLAVVLLAFDGAWLSAGQWGTGVLFTGFVVSVGSLVLHRAERSDVTWAFLATYLGLMFGRAWWLGDPWVVPVHALQSGALLVFAFFMISDPRSTPDSRAGRVLFAALVAACGFAAQYGFYRTNGLLWSLVLLAPLVPCLDRWMPGRRFEWYRHASVGGGSAEGGTRDETIHLDSGATGLPIRI